MLGGSLLVEAVMAEGNAGRQRAADFFVDPFPQWPGIHQLVATVQAQVGMA